MKPKRLLFLRVFLGVLIILNMVFIFRFSSESGQQSSQTSGKVAQTVAEVTVPHFEQKPQEEQQTIVNKLQFPIRKLAHMAEFASLGALIFLLLLTWRGNVMLRCGASIGLTALYAVSDEIHQIFSANRGPQFTDVLIDTSGAVLSCALVLLIWHMVHHKKSIVTTVCKIPCPKLSRPVRLAIASDLHRNPHDRAVALLREAKPDFILIPGDLTDYEGILSNDPSAFGFLRKCASIAPTFYSIGNHENGCYRHGNFFRKPHKRQLPAEFAERVAETGAILLRNSAVRRGEITFCGLDSGLDGKINEPDASALASFAALPGVRVLLCHHPEYYPLYIRQTDVDLTVCGHAHGGHWRFFGHGIFAPDQGLFPKYTCGVIDNRCVISRGLGDHTHIPRINNPRELVIVDFGG